MNRRYNSFLGRLASIALAIATASSTLLGGASPVARAEAAAPHGVTVSGRVTLPDGSLPLPAGVFVWLREPDPAHFDFDRDTHGRSTVDPATGAFSFANVPPGNYILRAVPADAAPYLVAPSSITPVRVLTGAVTLGDVALSTPTLTGTVYAPDGVTQSRAIVHVFRGPFEVERRWTETGGFAVGGLPDGAYRLAAEPWPADPYWGSRPVTANVQLSLTQSVSLTLTQPQIQGHAAYLSGAAPIPVPDALVRVINLHGERRLTRTNLAGDYAIGGLPPGLAMISTEPPAGMGWLLPPAPQAILVPATGVITVPLAFSVPLKVIGGLVRTNTGVPVAQAAVEAFRVDAPGHNSTATNAAGVYSMTLSPGLWAVHLHPEPATAPRDWVYGGPSRSVRFDRSPLPEAQRLNFEVLLADATVTGAVRLPDGSAPPFTVTARLHTDEGVGISQTVGLDGRYSFAIPHGVYRLDLEVSSRLYSALPVPPIVARPVTPTVVPTITLVARDATVVGLVTNNTGAAVPDIPVVVWNTDTHAAFRARTGPDGSYVTPVFSGTWFVRPDPLPVQPYVYTGTASQIVIASGQTVSDVNFALTAADATLHGVLVDADGTLLSDARGWAGTISAYRDIRTGGPIQNGEFDLLVPAGTYSTALRLASGYAYLFDGQPIVASVAASSTAVITFTLQKKTSAFYGALLDKRSGVSPVDVDGGVWAVDDGAWVGTDLRNSGLYELPVAPGLWRLNYAVAPDAGYVKAAGPRSFGIQSNQKQLVNLPVLRKDSMISGTVVLTDGVSPAAGAIVVAEGASPDLVGVILRAPVLSDGRFSLRVPAGLYTLRSTMPARERLMNPRAKNVIAPPGGGAVVALQYRQTDAVLTGQVSLAATPALTGTGPIGIYAYSGDDVYNTTVARASGAYTLPLISGETYTIVAALDARDSYWLTRTTQLVSGTTGLDLVLAGPKPKPAPVTALFDAADDKEIELTDDGAFSARIFIPGGALPVTGNVIVHITPLAAAPHMARGDVLGLAYAFEAYAEDGRRITDNFNKDVAITFKYDPAALAKRGVRIDQVKPVYFSTSTNSWTQPDSFVVDETRREITLQIDHFTDYSLVSEQASQAAGGNMFLPLITR